MNDTAQDLRSALERLKFHADFQRGYGADDFSMRRSDADIILSALAAPATDEPVGWLYQRELGDGLSPVRILQTERWEAFDRDAWSEQAVSIKSPPAAEPVTMIRATDGGIQPLIIPQVAAEPVGHWLEPLRSRDASGSPETAGQIGHSWLIDIARAEHDSDPAALEIDMPRLTEDGTAQILYRGPKIIAACFIVRDPMNFAVLFRYIATPARTDDAKCTATAQDLCISGAHAQAGGDVAAMREAAAKVAEGHNAATAVIAAAIRALPLPTQEVEPAAGVKDGLTSDDRALRQAADTLLKTCALLSFTRKTAATRALPEHMAALRKALTAATTAALSTQAAYPTGAGEGVKIEQIKARADAIAHLTIPEDGNYKGNGEYRRHFRIARDAALAAFEEVAAIRSLSDDGEGGNG